VAEEMERPNSYNTFSFPKICFFFLYKKLRGTEKQHWRSDTYGGDM